MVNCTGRMAAIVVVIAAIATSFSAGPASAAFVPAGSTALLSGGPSLPS